MGGRVRIVLGAVALLAGAFQPAVAGAQISKEIQEALDALRREINDLRGELRALRGSAPRQPPGTPPPLTQTPAPPPRITRVTLGNTPPLGSETAPVTVVEFSDYQCPFCAAFARTTLPQLRERYVTAGKVRWVAREFPLPIHPQAQTASHVALCAGRQGRYWQMHDKLYESQALFRQEPWDKLAETVGLELPHFQLCMESKAFQAAIQKEIEDGRAVGVTGTPSFFVGLTQDGKFIEGVFMAGNQPYQAFETEIEKLLAKASGGPGASAPGVKK